MKQLGLAVGRPRPPLLGLGAVALAAAGFAVAPVEARAPAHLPAASTALDVQPFPGTPDASRQTEIGFPALAPAQIRALAVTGSRSGVHGGRVIALHGGQGSEFVPRHPFAAGERVSVAAKLSSPAAGTASGAPGARRISFSFRIGVPASMGAMGVPGVARAAQDTNGLTHTFVSEKWLHPPYVTVSGRDPDPGQGDIVGDAERSIQSGPLILDPRGSLIYFQPLRHSAAFNVQVQTYNGQSVLTYFQGYVSHTWEVGIGHDVILNHHYQRIATVYAGHGYPADLHEFSITPRGDALITAYNPVRADLRSVGGSRHGTLLDAIIQKIDIATGKVLWEWHAYGHVHLRETYAGKPGVNPYDAFHINSIQQLPNGNLLVSMRHTWALYEVNVKTGRIPLNIGGKHSSFRIGPGANFEWQHQAQMQRDGTITVFDNATNGSSTEERQSRALRLRLDYKHRWVTLVRAFTHNPAALAGSQGSVEPLADGNTFVGWGAAPYLSEFGHSGKQLFNLRFRSSIQSYRGYRFRWWGQPTTPPSAAAVPASRGTFVFASWDGATTVARWRVLAGPSASALTVAGQHPKTHFETTIWVGSTRPYFEVQALDRSGNVLGTSRAVKR